MNSSVNSPEVPTNRRYVIDRGWSIRVGPVRLGSWYRSYVDDGLVRMSHSQPREPFFSTRAIVGGGLLCLCIFAAINLATDQARAKSGYAITIPVPPAVGRLPSPRPSTSAAFVTARIPMEVIKRKPEIHVAASHRPPASPPLVVPELSMMVRPFATVSQAQNIALTTGEMQQWEDRATGVRGFVVVGPLRNDGGKQCRAMSILTRSVDGDTVAEEQGCLH